MPLSFEHRRQEMGRAFGVTFGGPKHDFAIGCTRVSAQHRHHTPRRCGHMAARVGPAGRYRAVKLPTSTHRQRKAGAQDVSFRDAPA